MGVGVVQPIIGVTTAMEINEEWYFVSPDNIEAIVRSEGLPIMLPYLTDYVQINDLANKLDGLYLTGGGDIDPILFGEQPHQQLGDVMPARDHFELVLIRRMIELGKPILAVCRGVQILNIALGGDMYQDIYAQIDRELIQHQQQAPKYHPSHHVTVAKGSLLHQLTGKERLRVNSRHHQANRKIASSLKICAKAEDGMIEAIEGVGGTFILGLQWHPENMAKKNDPASLAIYRGFIQACKERRSAEK